MTKRLYTVEETFLFQLATQFYNSAESPSEEDMETVFHCLITHDLERLATFVNSFNQE